MSCSFNLYDIFHSCQASIGLQKIIPIKEFLNIASSVKNCGHFEMGLEWMGGGLWSVSKCRLRNLLCRKQAAKYCKILATLLGHLAQQRHIPIATRKITFVFICCPNYFDFLVVDWKCVIGRSENCNNVDERLSFQFSFLHKLRNRSDTYFS